jgi:hypothetical protein
VRVPLTVRHVYDFGADRAIVGDDLVQPERWDALRTQTAGGPFSIARSREELERVASSTPEIVARAAAIADLLVAEGVESVTSYGVGGAVLESCLLKARPGLRLTVTDYAPQTVVRLGQLLPEVTAIQHDLSREPPVPADLQLMHRIDAELDNASWRKVFERFRGEPVLFVECGLVDVRHMRQELRTRRRLGDRCTLAGWLRNRAAMERLWRKTHEAAPVQMHDQSGWLLRPR